MATRDKTTGQFRPTVDSDYVCNTWFERDNRQLSLETPGGRTIFRLVDEDFDQAIEDGFLKTPNVPRPSDADWQPQAVAYAREMGYIK